MKDSLTKENILKWIFYVLIVVIPFGVLYVLHIVTIIDDTLYSDLKNIFISVFTGIGASYCFLRFYLFYKKPKIEISNYICKATIEDEINYLFKFVNNTGVELYDVRFEAYIFTPFNDTTGHNLRGRKVSFARDDIYFMPKKDSKDHYNLHAIRIRTTDDIYTIWKNSGDASYLRLTIIAKHSLSGFNKVFTKDFLHPDNIICDKMFKKGGDLEIE